MQNKFQYEFKFNLFMFWKETNQTEEEERFQTDLNI